MEEGRPPVGLANSAVQEEADRLVLHESSEIAFTAAGSGAQAAAAGRRRSVTRVEDSAAREEDRRAAAAQASMDAAEKNDFARQHGMPGAGAGVAGAGEATSQREAPLSMPVLAYDSDDEPEEETGPVNYLLAQAEVLNAPPQKEKRKKRKKKKKLTAQEKKEMRREAQKRIVREQHARIRIRAQQYADECAKLDAQREQEYQWQVAERKAQLRAQQLEMNDGDGGDTAGGGLHPACAGLKMRDPKEFMRFYPAFTHPSFVGYKRDHAEIKDFAGAALESNAKAREHMRKNPLATGGLLCVRCEGWEGLRVPKSLRKSSKTDVYALDRHPGSEGVVQYAAVRLGDVEFNGIKFKNEHPADQRSVDAETLLEVGRAHDRAVAFGELDEDSDAPSDEEKPYETEDFDADPWGDQADPGWHTWDIGAEQDKHPHKMIVKMFSGEGQIGPRRVGEADVEWVEAVANMLTEGRAKMKAEAEQRAQKRRDDAMKAREMGDYTAANDVPEDDEGEEELSTVVSVPIRDRHGRAAGKVLLRIKYERRAYAAGAAKTSVKDIDILSGRAMVFGVPGDDAKRWSEADEEAEKLRLKEKVRKIKNEQAVADYEAQQALAFSDAEHDSDSESDSDTEGRRAAMTAEDTKAVRPGMTGAGAAPSAFAVAGAFHRTELTPAEMRRYNCAMSVHPSVWGYKLTPLTTHDASLISPVFFSSYLKLGDDAEIDRLGPIEQQQMEAAQQSTANWKPRPGKQPGDCPICFTSDVPGCPGCWDFPDPTPTMRRVIKTAMGQQKKSGKGRGPQLGIDLDDPDLTANDLEPLLTDAQQRLVRSEQLKEMHTKFKRRANIVQHRQNTCSYIRFLVKGILPPGPVVEFQCEKNDHVGFLYQQYCANAGPVIWNQREVFLLVVTDVGVFLIDNTDEPEDDYHLAWTTTDRKLSDYSMFTNATTVCLLMVPSLNSRTPRVIQRYLALNADLPGGTPDCTVHVELARCENVWSSKRQYLPDNLPGDDVVQSRLVALQEKLTGMHHSIEREEAALALAEAEARLQADWKARSRSNIGERRAYRAAREAAALARRERMKENALQAAVEQHEQLQKRKLKRNRRRHSPVQLTMGPTRLFLAREQAKASLARARVLARRAPGFAHRLANRGKEAIKNMYIRKLEQTILEEADERMIMDLPEPVYEVVKLQREKTFPYREIEVTRLRGRGLTMKFCLSALKLLGKPYELPREVTPPRRQRPRSQGRYHPSKAQLAYLRRKELIHKRMSDAAEARRRAREGLQVVEREPTPPPSSDSDDGEMPTSFAGLAPPKADRSLLVKQSTFHLPIINTQCSHNT